ncbi:MAG: sulfotransferase [Maritimibacter sp.]|uniref:sulfotransferase family protein n=1 Tax=Maritimibacter sp. TaxID=2003363 RepID=UPI001E0BD2B8|nr:sulfotransferase [Maritimibacter sp.]MBL6427642.1 sulfotransferase [Maritimibacter sp.]
MSKYDETPLVFILGAGRSGTNLLTFAFNAESPDFGNLGENRYIWTKGQADPSDDRRRATEVTPRLRRYLHRHFALRARRFDGPATVFLDKTPSNAFRISFAAEIFPKAKFIHIIRDGRDNLLSRSRQWKAQEPNEAAASEPMSALAGKLRFLRGRFATLRLLLREGALPADRIPAILRESARRQILPLLTGRSVMYGERVPGLDRVLAEEGVDAAAIVQWRESVMTAHRDGAALGPERYLELRYESFIADPVGEWHRIMAFLGRAPSGAGDAWLVKNVMERNSHKWVDPEAVTRISRVERHLRPALEDLGYGWDIEATR